ncbi:MAG TPA: type II secretion system secretin GspD [Polyangiaceae bacterium]|nr:type II secretion system secretin GspD [Polyangiaceae bacterium]
MPRCARALVGPSFRASLALCSLAANAAAQEPVTKDSESTLSADIAQVASEAGGGAANPRDVTFDLDGADLAELTRHIAALTKRRFIYDSRRLSGVEVSVVSPTKMSVNEAYSAYLAVLGLHGFQVVEQGGFSKIVESSERSRTVPPLLEAGAAAPEAALAITRIQRLEHVAARDAADVLAHFASPSGDISVYEPGRLLFLTDTAAHVERLLRLLEEIDVERAGARLWVEPIHYAGAARVAEQIDALFSPGASGATSLLRVVADEASSRLLIIGSEAGYASVLALLKRIDVAPAADGRVHVVALEHAVAEDLEKTLSALLADISSGAARTSDGRAPQPIGSFEGAVRVTADKATNSLIINASTHDYAELRPVIDELDLRPRQVFIDAVVLDLGSDDQTTLGVGYHGAGTASLFGSASSLLFGGMNAAQSTPNSSMLQALALGVRGPDVPGSEGLLSGDAAGVSIPAFGVALQALAVSSTSNVLSTPHVIALDNTTAEISVGKNVPLQINGSATDLSSLAALLGNTADGTGAAASALGGLGGTPRQDVGTRISITPHINEKDQVRLDIEEEISEEGAPSGDLGVVPIVQRSARTSIRVDDEQTVVIGGLVRDAQLLQEEKVPVLGDLPLLGALFRRRFTRTQKTNLILILTPHVIHSKSDLARVFERKMQERQEFLDRYFVFSSDWEPDTDLSRASGLVEKVRQALRADHERQQLELDRQPSERREHTPTTPIELPPDVSRGGARSPSSSRTAPGSPSSPLAPSGRRPAETVPAGTIPAGAIPVSQRETLTSSRTG